MFKTLIAAAIVVAMTSSPPAPRPIGDADIVALASKPFTPPDSGDVPASYVLGIHHGAKVIVDFRCGDVCPQATSRHIRYDVEPGPACDAIGGVTRTESFVQGIGVVRKDFCVPKVLVEKGL